MTIRILYIAGPGDVVGTFKCWIKGEADPSEMNATYSSQFFNVCANKEVRSYVISSNTRKDKVGNGFITVENLPMVFSKAQGALWHLQQILYGLKILKIALLFKPNVMVVSTGTHWFMLAPLIYLGVKIVPSLHCTFWCRDQHLGIFEKIINTVNSRIFFKKCFAVLSVSNEVTRQLKYLIGSEPVPVLQFLPTYESSNLVLQEKTNTVIGGSPVILYIGRIEENKGFVDLLNATKILLDSFATITLHFCGSGSMLSHLKSIVDKYEMKDMVKIHGHVNRSELQNLLKSVDVLVVPTRVDFVEGFNKVIIEGVLAGVPTVASDVCPAIEYVNGAVMIFEAGNVFDLVSKLKLVLSDTSAREKLVENCKSKSHFFYNPANGWEAAFSEVLESALEQRIPSRKIVPIEQPVGY